MNGIRHRELHAMLLGSILGLFLLVGVLPVQAQTSSYASWSETQLYGSGRDRVLKGRDLERAIAMLSALVARKPESADYQMLLGCACVSRLASLHWAAQDAKIMQGAQRAYLRRAKIWQQMQSDTAMPLFGRPQPVGPSGLTTQDDGKAYDPADKTTRDRVTDLSRQALHSFHEALRLGRSLPPLHKTEVNYTCGWGLLSLYRNARESVKYAETAPPSAAGNVPPVDPSTTAEALLTHEEIIACFQACTASNAKNADYWQSLAFAYAPDYITDILTNFDEEKMAPAPANRIDEAVRSLDHALALKGADPDLLYQQALVTSRLYPEKTLDSLQKFTNAQNANAVNFYLLAEAYLRHAYHLSNGEALQARQQALATLIRGFQAPSCYPGEWYVSLVITGVALQQVALPAGLEASEARREALAAIEKGNHAPQYFNAAMVLPVPKPLASAWNYRRTYGLGLDSYCLDTLFGFLAEAGSEAAQHKEGEALLRYGVCTMEMGLNALRHYDGLDLDPADLRTHNILYDRAYFGMIDCGKGYKWIKAAAEMSPDPALASLVASYAEADAYRQAWDAALNKKLEK